MAKAVKRAATKAAPAKKIVKNNAKPKKTATTNETGITYSDKSLDQPQLVPIFDAILKLLLPYQKGSMKLRGGSGGQVTLVNEKPVEIEGRKKDEFWFAAALVQRGYVGFYFMPVYTEAEQKAIFRPELLKCLKGKSCFHIKKLDAVILQQIEEALAKGYKNNVQKGWI